MSTILSNPGFAAAYQALERVSLNPRRHTAPNARAHCDAVAAMAARLGAANDLAADEIALLRDLGHAHDIGKVTGTARPAKSLEVLADHGVTDPTLLSLVKWHDTSLPWWNAAQRGQPASDKAWRRLASEVDLRRLCLFMVADRVDAPGGWRRNAPTRWFLEQARARAGLGPLVVELDDHPSEVSAGAALRRREHGEPEVLVIRVRAQGFELPKGGLEFDELPAEAAIRELREETAAEGELLADGTLGSLDYRVDAGDGPHLKRVLYHRVTAAGPLSFGPLPHRTHERRWVRAAELPTLPLVNEGLRPLLREALEGHDES